MYPRPDLMPKRKLWSRLLLYRLLVRWALRALPSYALCWLLLAGFDCLKETVSRFAGLQLILQEAGLHEEGNLRKAMALVKTARSALGTGRMH